MIPHKVLNIRCYICTCLALFFIFVFIRLLEYQILQFHASYFNFNVLSGTEEHTKNNNMKNNFFKLKDVTVIAIVGTVYWCIIQMMIDNGLLINPNDVIELGWENEYMESHFFSINRMTFLLSIPFEICGFLFFTLFIRKLKLFDCPKVLADTAFFMRCLSLVLPFANFILNFYIVLNFSESITMSPNSWYNTNPTDYFLLFSLRGKMWNMLSIILGVIANLALIVLFISIIKKHKVIGIAGTIFIPIYTICYIIPIPTTIILCGWIILFTTTLWEIKENRIKEEQHSTKNLLTISTIVCVIYNSNDSPDYRQKWKSFFQSIGHLPWVYY